MEIKAILLALVIAVIGFGSFMVSNVLIMSKTKVKMIYGAVIKPSNDDEGNHHAIVTKKDVATETPCKPIPKDIEIFYKEQKNGPICCRSCAIVVSSGILVGRNAGPQIDSNDCVLRLNDAPTYGYEKDVGTRTSIRVLAHSGFLEILSSEKNNNSKIDPSTFILQTASPERIKPDLKILRKYFPNSTMLFLNYKRIEAHSKLYISEASIKKPQQIVMLSTGLHAILVAKDLCNTVNIYGMVDEDFCDKVNANSTVDVKYHYYDDTKMQCDHYKKTKDKRFGEIFLSEKSVIKELAQKNKNINFFHPQWDLRS